MSQENIDGLQNIVDSQQDNQDDGVQQQEFNYTTDFQEKQQTYDSNVSQDQQEISYQDQQQQQEQAKYNDQQAQQDAQNLNIQDNDEFQQEQYMDSIQQTIDRNYSVTNKQGFNPADYSDLQDAYNSEQSLDEKNQNLQQSFWKNNKSLESKVFQEKVIIPEQKCPFLPLDEDEKILISVSKPIEKQTKTTKFTQYLITTQEQDQMIQVYRRYSEFEALRKALSQHFLGVYIPPIPGKQNISVADHNLVKYRMKVLNGFLKKLVNLPILFNSNPVQIFLKSPEYDVKKLLENLPMSSTVQTIETLGNHFSHLQGFEINDDVENEIAAFQKQVFSSGQKLKNIVPFVDALATIKDQHDQNVSSLFEFCFQEYETVNLAEYVGNGVNKSIISNQSLGDFQKQKEKLMNHGKFNPYRHMLETLQNEQLEIQSIKETLDQKFIIQQKIRLNEEAIKKNGDEITKLQMGKTKITKIFSSKKPEERIQDHKNMDEKLQVERENLLKLQTIIVALFYEIEIKRFKENKKIIYEKLMELVSSSEVNKTQDQMEFWKQLGELASQYQ